MCWRLLQFPHTQHLKLPTRDNMVVVTCFCSE